MKKIIALLSCMISIPFVPTFLYALPAKSATHSYNGFVANETALAYNNNYVLDAAMYDGNRISAVVAYSSATIPAKTFTKYNMSSGDIFISQHGFTTALPVLFTGTGTIGGLSSGTTYYAVPDGINAVRLATSSANAIAGTYEVFASSTTGQSITYTLSPLAITGTPSFKWQASNDGVAYFDMSVSSITMSSYTYPYAVAGWDFDTFNYRYLRLSIIGPTTGGIYLNATAYIKQQ
jgi:hypothetical protein